MQTRRLPTLRSPMTLTLDGVVLILIWWVALLTIFLAVWIFVPKHKD